MRSTLNLPDELMLQAKTYAARHRTTLTALVESGLRRELERRQAAAADASVAPSLPVFRRGSGPRAGIDLTSNASMLDACDADS